MGEVYKGRKKGALSRFGDYVKGYADPIPVLGGCATSGAMYMGGMVVGAGKELIFNSIPTIVTNGDVYKALSTALQSGYGTAAQLGLVGFLLGTVVVRHFRDKVYGLLGVKKK